MTVFGSQIACEMWEMTLQILVELGLFLLAFNRAFGIILYL